MATSLPHDVIINILLLLPIKTLQCFKPTCKLWFSTIQSQQFIKAHRDLQIINQEKKILLSKVSYDIFNTVYYYSTLKSLLDDHIETNPLYSSNLPKPDHGDMEYYYTYVSCCHGLVFMVFSDGLMILWNPATRKHHQIPPNNCSYYYSVNSLLPHPTYCFGHDSSADDYKILRFGKEIIITEPPINQPIRVDMYSVNNGSWRTTGLLPTSDYNFNRHQDPVMFKGAFHFIADDINNHKPKDDGRWNQFPRQILSFCWVQETFIKTCELDDQVNRELSIFYPVNLCVLNEKLSLTGFLKSKYEIWSIMNYEENTSRPCWSRIISISFEIPRQERLWIFSTKFVVKGGVLLMGVFDFDNTCYEYLIFDPRKQQCRKIMEFHNCLIALDYVETLVSPDLLINV